VLRFGDCPTYQDCVADVAEFLNDSCAHVADTTPGESAVPAHCAFDAQSCRTDADCYNVEIECADGDCQSCDVDAECSGEGERCYDGFCQLVSYRCRDDRCYRICENDADCPGEDFVPEGQHLCVGGVCLPESDGLCADDADCAPGPPQCFGDGAVCTTDEDCAAETVCRSRLCVPEPVDCEDHPDCTLSGLGEGARCLRGRCVADADSCDVDGDCGEDGACVDGLCTRTCQICLVDEACPDGHVCSHGFCVVPVAICDENRCRTSCSEDDDCLAGARCQEGRCLPLDCTSPRDLETICRMDNLWKAQAQCQRLSCPVATTDGRIKRVLPENLENLPDFTDLDDAQDFDEDVYGGAEGG